MRWKAGNCYRKCFFPAYPHTEKDDDRAQQDYRKIAIFPVQLRHIFEIHAVPAHNQCEWQKNGGNHGQDFHDFILADVNLGLVDLPELRGIFPEHKGLLMQPAHPLAEKTEGSQFIPGEKTMIILL